MKNRRRKRRGKDGLVTKVLGFNPVKDKGGKEYIPFCTYKIHVGLSLFQDVCEKRKCWHYRRLYIN